MAIQGLTARPTELGRIRIGSKNASGIPIKLDTFRLTSERKELLLEAALIWGGQVEPWKNQWQLITDVAELPVLVPDQDIASSQFFELWGGKECKRRCDGVTEFKQNRPCQCSPENRQCSPVTHINLLLPQIPEFGVWHLSSTGFNAAGELLGQMQILNQLRVATGKIPPATLAISHREKDGGSKKFVVPELRIQSNMVQLASEDDLVIGETETVNALPAASVVTSNGAQTGEGHNQPSVDHPVIKVIWKRIKDYPGAKNKMMLYLQERFGVDHSSDLAEEQLLQMKQDFANVTSKEGFDRLMAPYVPAEG